MGWYHEKYYPRIADTLLVRFSVCFGPCSRLNSQIYPSIKTRDIQNKPCLTGKRNLLYISFQPDGRASALGWPFTVVWACRWNVSCTAFRPRWFLRTSASARDSRACWLIVRRGRLIYIKAIGPPRWITVTSAGKEHNFFQIFFLILKQRRVRFLLHLYTINTLEVVWRTKILC